MDDKAVLVDTNVLLAATAPLRPLYRAALMVLNDWPNKGILLAVSSQVLREYLAVATRPVEVNGWVSPWMMPLPMWRPSAAEPGFWVEPSGLDEDGRQGVAATKALKTK